MEKIDHYARFSILVLLLILLVANLPMLACGRAGGFPEASGIGDSGNDIGKVTPGSAEDKFGGLVDAFGNPIPLIDSFELTGPIDSPESVKVFQTVDFTLAASLSPIEGGVFETPTGKFQVGHPGVIDLLE